MRPVNTGIGAASGAAAATGNPTGFFAAGAISGVGNTAFNGGGFGQIVQNGFVGGFTGLAGGFGGRYAFKLGLTFNGFGINSPFLKGLVAGGLGGAGGGFSGGFTSTLITGGDFSDAWNAGLSGANSGWKLAAPIGAVAASVQAHRSGVNPLTGKRYDQPTSTVDEFLDVARDYLGDDFTIVKPAYGSDLILKSADGLRQMRFDLSNPHGLPPHVNIQQFHPRNLYPNDVRNIEDFNIHVYPKKH